MSFNFDSLPADDVIKKKFEQYCKKLSINMDEIKNLVIYELTDGTRTSMDAKGWENYFDGGIFILRLFHMLSVLGSKHAYVLTTGSKHQLRDNYHEIVEALKKQVDIYREFSEKQNIKLKFVADFSSLKSKENFIKDIKKLEAYTSKNTGLTAHILINYSSDWAHKNRDFKNLPNANIIIKHTKGQVNEGLWLPGKLHNNGFVYAQNASVSRNWSDDQILWLIALSLKSMIAHKGKQYTKSYEEGEAEKIRELRENKLYMVHRKLKWKPNKRVIIFNDFGPEIYEF